jgi:hypothetical protein
MGREERVRPRELGSGSGPGRIEEPVKSRKPCRTGRNSGREEGERGGRPGKKERETGAS